MEPPVAHQMWRTLEPFHALVYLVPEADALPRPVTEAVVEGSLADASRAATCSAAARRAPP